MKKISITITHLIRNIFVFFLAISLPMAFMTPNFKAIHIDGHYWLRVLGVLASIALPYWLSQLHTYRRLKRFKLSTRPVIGLLILLFIWQLIIYLPLTLEPVWDPGVIMQNVTNPIGFFYFSWNYNNTLLLTIERLLYHLLVPGLFTSLPHALLFANAIIIDLAVFNMYLIGNRLKDRQLGTILFSLGLLFFGLSPWVLVFYSDTLGLYMLTLLILIVCQLRRAHMYWQKLSLLLLYTIMALIAYLLKPTTLIFSIAVILSMLIQAGRTNNLKQNFSRLFIGLLLFLTVFAVGAKYYHHYIYQDEKFYVSGQWRNLDPELRLPPTHFIAMGLKGIGGFNGRDAAESYQAKTYQARDQLNRRKIKQRLQQYGIVGYFNFLFVKHHNNVANGNFVWDGDRSFTFKNNPAHQSKLAQFSMSFNYSKGHARPIMRFLNQVTWIVLLVLTLLSAFTGRVKHSLVLQSAQLAIVGQMIYLLIFEGGTTRYLFMWLPCFIICGYYGALVLKNCAKLNLFPKKEKVAKLHISS
ncbi:hypothetical protein ACNAN0_11560 [Agrilactobacillus fermenti]|uniref:hypothetical protein n=1 Tax=Agrilactobacillus fermenti TaxID=2586909 RepID=UPI003A5BDB3C